MTDLDLDSKAILNGLVYLDQHNQLPPSASDGLGSSSPHRHPSDHPSSATPGTMTAYQHSHSHRLPEDMAPSSPGVKGNNAAAAAAAASPHAIATLKVETSAVLKELARFRACDDQTMSCFYCREWAQWVYRKQVSPQTGGSSSLGPQSGSIATLAAAASSSSGNSRKKKSKAAEPVSSSLASPSLNSEELAERESTEQKRAIRRSYSTVASLCQSLRGMVADEQNALQETDPNDAASRSVSPTPPTSAAATNEAASSKKDPAAIGDTATGDDTSGPMNSDLIRDIVERVTLWYEGYQSPLAEVYEDLKFDFPPDTFPYDNHQDPLDPSLLLPALQVSKAFIALPASKFPLLGNITSELIATHTYPTCQHTKADHPTPSELETQRLIFNSQLQKRRGEYKQSFEREMEPVWHITQLLLKSAQRIETMRVRLFARGCRSNREQLVQTIRNRTQPFAEYWARVSEPYKAGKAAKVDGTGEAAKKTKSQDQLVEEVDSLLYTHLDNLLEVSSSWSRTFLESYYGVAREFARELETILSECITMCDRRAQGLKYPPPLTLQPQLDKAQAAIGDLLPHLESRIERIQKVVVERNAEIFKGTEEVRKLWAESSGTTLQTKLARAAQKDIKKKMRRIEFHQQSGVIGWAMRELEHLLTAPDVATVVTDCLELLMTEAEILERAVGQVFMRKLESTTEDLREKRQDIIDDFTEGLLTGREELAGVIGKLMLKEAWRILETNISLQRQKALLDGGGKGGGKGNKKNKANNVPVPPVPPPAPILPATTATAAQTDEMSSVTDGDDLLDDDDASSTATTAKKRKNKKKKNKKKKAKAAATKQKPPVTKTEVEEKDEKNVKEEEGNPQQRDPKNPFDTLSWIEHAETAGMNESEQPEEEEEEEEEEDEKELTVDTAAQPKSNEDELDSGGVSAAATTAAKPLTVNTTRSRRNTNAARYVPGVGFVSDDGVAATTTSPQLPAAASATSASYKMNNGAGGLPASGALRASAASVLGLQKAGSSNAVVRKVSGSSNGGRRSPMSAARLMSSTSRSHSPLATNTQALMTKEGLEQFHQQLLAGDEEMETMVREMAYENLVALALSAVGEQKRMTAMVTEWSEVVGKVTQAYDSISTLMQDFHGVMETGQREIAKLTEEAERAGGEARRWQAQYEEATEELKKLKKSSGSTTSSWVGGFSQPPQHPWGFMNSGISLEETKK